MSSAIGNGERSGWTVVRQRQSKVTWEPQGETGAKGLGCVPRDREFWEVKVLEKVYVRLSK